MNSDRKIIEDAQTLYNKGEWEKTIDFIDMLFTSRDEQQVAEINRIKSWSYYYLAIKGDESLKSKNLEKAEECFRLALIKMEKKESIVSILNGLPLVLWIQGKRTEAWEISDKAINKFPETPSIWNTRGILCRWAKNFNEAVEVGQRVFETAVKVKDFRTAGHGKQNKADALVQSERIEEAKKDYIEAIKMYKKYEEKTEESALFHLKRVQEKLSNL
ncbi:MAG: tetratricopeptide repeat protein [Candidatus Nealsonbacteria bacterium]